MRRLVIADTSCLIVLSKIAKLSLLKELFQEITITQEVAHEFGEELPEWISILTLKDPIRKRILQLELDEGEASAIALGLEHDGSLLLIDERKGRQKATELGLKILGTLGVLIKAKEKGLITSLTVEIDRLRKIDFRMSEALVSSILKKYEHSGRP